MDGWYYFDDEVKKWLKSTGGKPAYFESLKPIEKPMKEYLDPKRNYELCLSDEDLTKEGMIEIPYGAEDYRGNNVFYKNKGAIFFNGKHWESSSYNDFSILWQREPELPFNTDLEDAVNHPTHYTSDPSGIECIEVTRHRNFNIGNAMKYLWRNGLKDSDAQVQDLEKAIWYIQDEIKRLSIDK